MKPRPLLFLLLFMAAGSSLVFGMGNKGDVTTAIPSLSKVGAIALLGEAEKWNGDRIGFNAYEAYKKNAYAKERLDLTPGEKTAFDHGDRKYLPFTAKGKRGLVIGKLKISEGVSGLLMLESGFYSFTRVYLYPVEKDGMILSGLQVADEMGDEGRQMEFSSSFITENDEFVVTTEVIFTDSGEEGEIDPPKKEIFEYRWRFKDGIGFEQVKTK